MDEVGKLCEIPIMIDPDMPIGMGAVVSMDGKRLGTIINMDIETCGPVTLNREPPKIYTGLRECRGSFTTSIGDFKAAAETMQDLILQLGDGLVASGVVNRSGRKAWRKEKKRVRANRRRALAREERERHGLATF